MRRSSLFWGSALILLSGLFLLKATGILQDDVLGYFWPLLLLLLGVWVLASAFLPRETFVEEGQAFAIDLQGASEAKVDFNKKIDFRIITGVLLILGGILGLLDKIGIIKEGFNLFWAVVFGFAGIVFLYFFFTNRNNWWAAIPGFTLAGIAASSFLPDGLGWDGLAFLGGIGLGFWAVYFSGRDRWWAIIPGGVLITLGATAALSEAFRIQDTGSVFFIGLGLTFLLVAVLARQTWAYIPAVILIVFGALIDTAFQGSLDYVWIVALFLGGLALIWQFFRSR